MKKIVISLFTRTPMHVGAGNSVGVVDMPVQRERHTRIPIVPGSSLKGVISDLWNEEQDGKLLRSSEGKKLFGEDDNNAEARSGALLIGEARALAFPVRSAKGMFAWVSCPMALRRFQSDTGLSLNGDFPELEDSDALASDFLSFKEEKKIILEEYVFNTKGSVPEGVIETLLSLQPDNTLWQELGKRLVIINDSLFSHFVENACEVVARIKVDDETGTVSKGGLFNQEQVPSETMFYSLAIDTDNRDLDVFLAVSEKVISVGNLLQIGGNSSIGLGLCDVVITEVTE